MLVGVSRTSKTPLSIYLGYLGWKATNVPLVKGIDPPAAALRDRSGTGSSASRSRRGGSHEIRSQRLVLMGGDRSYADLNEIYEDLEHASAIHRRIGCPVIDVSELSIEEIALRIVRSVERRTGVHGPRSVMKPKPPVPKWRWAMWMGLLGTALVVFYGLFTPFWFASALAGVARRVPVAAPGARSLRAGMAPRRPASTYFPRSARSARAW